MVLTPDQKKRIAALDVKAAEAEDKAKSDAGTSQRLQATWLSLRFSSLQPILVKALIICTVCAVAVFFILEYELHKIDFQNVFSSGPGTPVSRLSNEIRTQRQKTEMLKKGQMLFLEGNYKEAFDTGASLVRIDEDDPRAHDLMIRTADATTRKATREFDSGEIESALQDVRLALKYQPEHRAANELFLNIAARLLHEAKLHHNKKEFPQAITKTQEVQRIVNDVLKLDASGIADSRLLMETNIESSNLLSQTNNELLNRADDLLYSQDYLAALQMVRLSMRIDKKNAHALRLMRKISLYIEEPELKLKGIIKSRDRNFARIQLPDNGKVLLKKEGDFIKNAKVIKIDANQRKVELMQIHTKKKFTISQPTAD